MKTLDLITSLFNKTDIYYWLDQGTLLRIYRDGYLPEKDDIDISTLYFETKKIEQVIPQILGVIIFEWEINIRRSAILGLVGAGGLGLVFFRQMNTFNFHGVTSVIISILGIIVIGEFVSHKMRKRVI